MRYWVVPLMLLAWSAHAEFMQCKGHDGNVLYTDKPALCADKPIVKQENKLAGYLKPNKGVNYRLPARHYEYEQLGAWRVYSEEGMSANWDKIVAAKQKLLKSLEALQPHFPPNALSYFQTLNIYLMWGPKSPLGGEASGMRYVRKTETKFYPNYDPAWENAIIIYSAENLLYLNDLWAQKSLAHEFSHAWHIANWPDKESRILAAWENARAKGLYLNVQDINGSTHKRAYALTNTLEYFAELSAMYFMGGNYFPFDRQGLRSYDPQGFKLIETLWGEK